MNDKLLITLDDITMIDDGERVWELYFLVLGYDLMGNADQIQHQYVDGKDFLGGIITSKGLKLSKWFYGMVTPIFLVERKYKHNFPGGLPLYMGLPNENIVSFYFAIIDSDQRSRNTGELLGAMLAGQDTEVQSILQKVGSIVDTAANLPANLLESTLKQGFGLLINSVQTVLINQEDDLKYTNIFSFAKHNEYLCGSHDDWGNQRAKFTITSRMIST